MATAKRQERKAARKADKAVRVEKRREHSARSQRTARKANRQAEKTERQRLRSEAKAAKASAYAAAGIVPGQAAADFASSALDTVGDFASDFLGGGAEIMPGETGGIPDGGDPGLDAENESADTSGNMLPLVIGGAIVAAGGLYLATRK